MNSKDVLPQKIDGIYSIQLIPPPLLNTQEIVLIIILITLLIIILSYLAWRLFFSRKMIAKRKLYTLTKNYKNNKIDLHHTIYNLCNIIQERYGILQLNKDTPNPSSYVSDEKNDWSKYVLYLSRIRYEKNIIMQCDINRLFKDSFFWLGN